jgi:phage terminase large subunit-like protein
MPESDGGDRAVNFIRRLKHTKGQWHGVSFDLRPWQEKIIRDLFGTVKEDGARQYRTAYIEVPRKNGKSELAAAIALVLLFADGEEGAEIYSAAADTDQASIVFDVANQMVKQSVGLSQRSKAILSTKRIVYKNSFYRVLSAEHATKHGFNAHGVIFDELHAQPNRSLWDVLTTSGGTRRQPMTVAITTAGYDRNSICWEQHEYARKVLDGVVDDPTYYAVIFSAPDEADWTDEVIWKNANPALGDFRDIDEMRTLCKRAQQTPALQNTFRRLYLNQWTRQESRWLDIAAWDATAGIVEAEDLRGEVAYAGLDLASSSDLAALVLVFPDDEGMFDVLPFFWVPQNAIEKRSMVDRVPYDVWVEDGLIEATPGDVIDYRYIRKRINELGVLYNLKEIAFDRWGAQELIQYLQDDGFTVVEFGQGFASMAMPTRELLNLVLAKKLRHGGNPVLKWQADNLVVRQDPAGNVKPDKSKSTEKIDGMVALIMGIDRALRNEKSVYDERGVLSL